MSAAEEIRDLAIERVARRWCEMDDYFPAEVGVGVYRDDAAELVDALGDLLPTGVDEIRVLHFEDVECGEWCATKGHMIGAIGGHRQLGGWRDKRRYVTDFQEFEP